MMHICKKNTNDLRMSIFSSFVFSAKKYDNDCVIIIVKNRIQERIQKKTAPNFIFIFL